MAERLAVKRNIDRLAADQDGEVNTQVEGRYSDQTSEPPRKKPRKRRQKHPRETIDHDWEEKKG